MSIRLIPPHSELTAPYWAGAREQRLVLQRCGDCAHWLFPPGATCPECGSANLAWTEVSGKGQVYTFTIARRPPHPILAGLCPLAIAVVQLAEGPRMMSNVVGCDPEDVEIDMPLQVAFEPIDGSETVLPVFRPARRLERVLTDLSSNITRSLD